MLIIITFIITISETKKILSYLFC